MPSCPLEPLEPGPDDGHQDEPVPANDDEKVQNEPKLATAAAASPSRWHPASIDVPPLTAELRSLLGRSLENEEACRLFVAGRRRQIDDHLTLCGRRSCSR